MYIYFCRHVEELAWCLEEFGHLRRVRFRCVKLDANEASNLLTRIGMDTEEAWFYIDNPPPEIAEILNADVNGRYVSWVCP